MADWQFRLDNLVSALVGGVAGGALVWALAPSTPATTPGPDDTVPSEVAAATPPEMDPDRPAEPTTERLKRLETTMQGMQKRVAEQARVDGYEEGVEGEEGEPKRITLNAADPKFQSAVRAVIDNAKWEQEQIEQDKRDEERDKRIVRQVDELAQELNLTQDQADQVELVFQSRADTMRALRDGDDRPVTRQDWRQKFTEIQAETRKKLAEVFDEEQLAAYDKFQEEQGFGPWGGRPRPPR